MTGNSSNLEEMFKDRYTNKDERYAKMAEQGFETVVVVHPWNPRRDSFRRGGNNNAHRGGRGHYQGGFPGGFRAGWNDRGNRGGGHRGGYRAGDRRRRDD